MKSEALAMVLVVLLVVAVIATVSVFYGKAGGTTSTINQTTSSTSVSTSASTSVNSTASTGFSLNAPNRSELVDESPSGPFDSLDPQYGFFTTDVQFAQVFQSLVSYNGSDSLHVVPALADSWSVSSNYENYTFTMRPNIWFSNKDPINAYTAWFSFVRVNYMDAPTTVGYSNYDMLLYNGPTPGQNVVPWGLYHALQSVDPNLKAEKQLTNALNQMLSNYDPEANATQAEIVSDPHQALVAINATTFQINLIQPYSSFLLALPPQWGAVVDPVWIDANGGVGNNTWVTNFNTGDSNKTLMPGSGPYEYASASPYSSIALKNNPNYWAVGVDNLSTVLQPARIPNIVIRYGLTDSKLVTDFGDSEAQISYESVGYFGRMYNSYEYASHFSFYTLLKDFGTPPCELGTALNAGVFPTNITDFRLAIVHAVNYSAILNAYTFEGRTLATFFQPPAPPGLGPTDNPDDLQLYSFNVTLAEQYLNESGFQGHFYTVTPDGVMLGNKSAMELPSLLYPVILPMSNASKAYVSALGSGLARIGVNLTIFGAEGCYAGSSCENTDYPFEATGWCADWADPVFQIVAPLEDPQWPVFGSPHYSASNSTLLTLIRTIPFETSVAQQVSDSIRAWEMYSQLVPILQSPLQDTYAFVQPYVEGVTYSPYQNAIYYNMLYYYSAS